MHFTFHDLRHTFASHMVMEGVDITTVSRLLGHATLTMTLRYAHLAPKHMASAVNVQYAVKEDRRVAVFRHGKDIVGKQRRPVVV